MAISEIQSDIQAIENDASLFDEANFASRANAIDFIDFHIIDRINGLQAHAKPVKELEILKQHVIRAKSTLEAVDTNLFKKLRNEIKNRVDPAAIFSGKRSYNVSNINSADEAGYNNLDLFVNGILSCGPVPEPTLTPGAEMVFYQKTPARIVFQLAALAQLKQDDVFFDIGSGLGQVCMLVNLISGAEAIGVEYEPAYCNYAKVCAAELNLSNVQFINADARQADYSSGRVFFMYTPFEGSVLQDMLGILEKESQKRLIRIFTYGPCSPQVARQGWLTCVNGDGSDIYKLYEFKGLNEDGDSL